MYAIIVVTIKQSGNTMAQHVILIAPEDIKKEPEDSVLLLCSHCQLAVEILVDSSKNTTPFLCDFCMAEGREDINIEQNRKWITALLIDAESTNASTCNYQHFSIHWADWTALLVLIIFNILLFVGYFGVFA